MTVWTDTAVKPTSWLVGWVDTDSPGYRKVQINAGTYTVAAQYQRFPGLLADINTAVAVAGWSITLNNKGQVRFTGSSATITWTDRLGWLLGMATDPADSPGATTSESSLVPPPGCIPLLSASWESVERMPEEQLIADRWQRSHGYVWGAAEVWRWRLRMVESAAHSLMQGHCLAGKITLTGVQPTESWSDTAYSSSAPTGYLDGYVVGLEDSQWIGPSREVFECTLLVAATVGS